MAGAAHPLRRPPERPHESAMRKWSFIQHRALEAHGQLTSIAPGARDARGRDRAYSGKYARPWVPIMSVLSGVRSNPQKVSLPPVQTP